MKTRARFKYELILNYEDRQSQSYADITVIQTNEKDTEVEKSKVDLGMSQACCCPLSCSCSTDLSSHPL